MSTSRSARGETRSAPATVRVSLDLAELEQLRDFAHNVDDPDHDEWWAQLDRKLTAALHKARAIAARNTVTK